MFGKKYRPIIRVQWLTLIKSLLGVGAHIKWKFGPNFIAAWAGVGFIRHALGIV